MQPHYEHRADRTLRVLFARNPPDAFSDCRRFPTLDPSVECPFPGWCSELIRHFTQFMNYTLEAVVLDNPAAGNYEELADLHLDQGHYARARACYDKAIAGRAGDLDPIYRRAIAEIHLDDYAAAIQDLETVTSRDPKYDFNRAIALLAHAYAGAGQAEQADALFRRATEVSTLSETYYNYAVFLASQKRTSEARDWAGRLIARKPTLPRYLQRRERPWFRKAAALMKRLPA